MNIKSALLTLAGLTAFSIQAAEKEKRVSLRFQTVENLSISRNAISLRRQYAQTKDEPISFEAEGATIIELQNSKRRIMSSPDASGRCYVAFAKRLEFTFRVETPGKYKTYYRSWFPLRASYNHHEALDDGPTAMVVDSNKLEPKNWHWVAGPTYSITKGRHTLKFPSPSAFCAGARLDKVVLLPVSSPPPVGLGPVASRQCNSNSGSAITRRVKLKRIASAKLKYEIIANSGKVEIKYSFDKKHWIPAPPSGTELRIPSGPSKPKYIYFKVDISAKKETVSPRILAMRLMIIKTKPTMEK